MANIIRCDSEGIPFEYPTLYLKQREYAKIISEINTNYDLYRGKPYCIHHSLDIDGVYYIYYFENRRFNDYNIVQKFKL